MPHMVQKFFVYERNQICWSQEKPKSKILLQKQMTIDNFNKQLALY